MFDAIPMSPEIARELRGLPPDLADTIRRVYRAHAALLAVASRDREVLLALLDHVGIRLDELPADPRVARAKAEALLRSREQP